MNVLMSCLSVLLARLEEPCVDVNQGPMTVMDLTALAECVEAVSIGTHQVAF